MDRPTWEALREEEPALAEIERRARAIRDAGGDYFCANDAWFDVKERLRELLGVWRRRPAREPEERARLLGDAEAFETAFNALYPLLPPCRNCGCARFEPLRLKDRAARERERAQAAKRR